MKNLSDALLVSELWASDAASALTNRAARRIEELSEKSLDSERVMRNIAAMKGGIIDAAGKEKGERFIGRNIEVLMKGLFEGWTEAETLSKCEWITD